MFKGSGVALVTPMNLDGSINYTALQNLVDWHLSEKTNALIVVGTTGEAPTLTTQEQTQLISAVVKQVAKRIPVIAGTGTNSTAHTIELTALAKKAGADGCLIVTPYYNKPPQNGLYEHFKTIAEHVAIPIMMYNVPGRTGCDILPETVERLAKIPNIVGIKEATGQVPRTAEIVARCADGFTVVCGSDEINLGSMQAGAKGVISVTANVVPGKMREFCDAALQKNDALAEKIHLTLMPLHKNLFLEANPIPVKWAVNQMGLIPTGIRLPLVPLNSQYHAAVLQAMQLAGVEQKVYE